MVIKTVAVMKLRVESLMKLAVLLALSLCSAGASAEGFRFAPVNDKSLGLWEGQKPVLTYNHGVLLKAGVPEDRKRSTYVHPIYGLDGEVLTDDFPKDHYHHRGLFWSWPHIKIEGKEYDLWGLKGIEQRFERWLATETSSALAVLGVENGWYVGGQKVVQERVWLYVYPATDAGRFIDLDLTWIPLGKPLTLVGAPGKSYGGVTLRFAPRTNTVITTKLGNGTNDLPMTHLPWADLSAQFAGAPQPSGAAIFVPPSHPDFPPMWLTRHYGALCLGWPGVEPKTFPADEPIRCRYRVWVHRGIPTQAALEAMYGAYELGLKAKGER